jgi:assimilatory nitrate reductase catalytic subunit
VKLDFLVVQDMYPTIETAQRAHLYLPAAGWGEKEGTLINSERRIGLVKKVCRAPGQALSDFNILKLVAEYWGCGAMFERWRSPEAAFQLMKKISRGQPCDITGIRDYAMLDECGGIQWPWPESSPESRVQSPEQEVRSVPRPSTLDPRPLTERRLFADGRFFTPDERAKFIFDPPGRWPSRWTRNFRSCCSPAAARRHNGIPARAPAKAMCCVRSRRKIVTLN